MADEPTPAEEAYRAHRGQIYSFLLRKTGDPNEAEELTQSVFTDATVVLARTETAPTSLLGWLYAVADRRFIDELRRRARDKQFADLSAPVPVVSSDEYGSAVATAIKRAVEQLPEEQRKLVVMKVLEGRSFRELAQFFEITEAACKMRFSRAIKLVRESLEEAGYRP